jgi:hypothetical protein
MQLAWEFQRPMAVRAQLSDHKSFGLLHNSAVRAGIYTGVCLATVLTLWLILANRVPFFESFAVWRNMGAALLFALFALAPALRFYRSPESLLVSCLVAWTILTIMYRLLCVFFSLLGDKYSAWHIFMLGAVVYLIAATLSWIGTLIWRARQADISHSKHHVS